MLRLPHQARRGPATSHRLAGGGGRCDHEPPRLKPVVGRTGRRLALIALFLLVLALEAVANTDQVGAENPLITALRESLAKENPVIERVAVLEVRGLSPAGPYVLIGWGIRADDRFEGSFRDEPFGVFVVNPELTRIERTLEIIPTPRWLDYSLWIEELRALRVTVVGKGSTYGDGPIRRIYQLQQ
jgi:hypothetical protein